MERTSLKKFSSQSKTKRAALDLSMLTHQAMHGLADKLLNDNYTTNHGRFLETSKTIQEKENETKQRETIFINEV